MSRVLQIAVRGGEIKNSDGKDFLPGEVNLRRCNFGKPFSKLKTVFYEY